MSASCFPPAQPLALSTPHARAVGLILPIDAAENREPGVTFRALSSALPVTDSLLPSQIASLHIFLFFSKGGAQVSPFYLFICLFIFRERGRVAEREGEKLNEREI